MARSIALLRAVNVGGRKLPMAELRALCAELGWNDAVTYIQSGNIVFTATGTAGAHETELEKAIAGRFGFHSDVIVRSAEEWERLVKANPFPQASETEANRVIAGFSKKPLNTVAVEAIAARAVAGERVAEAGGALWFHYPAGVGTSKITPSLIDRSAGSPVTARNWRTLLALRELAS